MSRWLVRSRPLRAMGPKALSHPQVLWVHSTSPRTGAAPPPGGSLIGSKKGMDGGEDCDTMALEGVVRVSSRKHGCWIQEQDGF